MDRHCICREGHHSNSWREIPIFRILDWRVVRFIPSLTAAPCGPAITPLVSRKTRIMYWRSRLWSVPSLSTAAGSHFGQRSVEDSAVREDHRPLRQVLKFTYIARHSQLTSALMVALGMISICLFIRRENF